MALWTDATAMFLDIARHVQATGHPVGEDKSAYKQLRLRIVDLLNPDYDSWEIRPGSIRALPKYPVGNAPSLPSLLREHLATSLGRTTLLTYINTHATKYAEYLVSTIPRTSWDRILSGLKGLDHDIHGDSDGSDEVHAE